MLELRQTEAAFITVAAEGVSRLGSVEAATVYGLASDEALIMAPLEWRARLTAAVAERAQAIDSDAVVIDSTDGWVTWTLEGDALRAAFSRLSGLDLPDRGFVQGDVARVPAKVIADVRRLHVVVPAMWSEYLHDRIVERCGALGIVERPLATFTVPEPVP